MRDFKEILYKIDPFRFTNQYYCIEDEINIELEKNKDDEVYCICLIILLTLSAKPRYSGIQLLNSCVISNFLCDVMYFQDPKANIRINIYIANPRIARNVVSITKNNESVVFKNVFINERYLNYIRAYLEEIFNMSRPNL
jgi:hypothetical protein